MSEYRDYGAIYGQTPSNVIVDSKRKSQVYYATHDRAGDPLPARLRSFISFSFGGKNIEDFELIACCEGDTMSRKGYADFEDLTTSYDIMDGQYYHGTHFKPNTLSLRLVSESIDQRKLDEFLHWFRGGMTRELILAEHPNRAIMARVAAPPQLEMLPYEKKVMVNIGIGAYETSTTVYKGFITLDLVADSPFWYAKSNILLRGEDQNGDPEYNGQSIFTDENTLKEALKIIYEDTVPAPDMVQYNMHFGGDTYIMVGDGDNAPYTLIAERLDTNNPGVQPANWQSNTSGYFIIQKDGQNQYWKGAAVQTSVEDTTNIGRIAGAFTAAEDGTNTPREPIAAGDTDKYYFFYGGTAPSPVQMSFTINLTTENVNGYINCIGNEYALGANNKEYSSIFIKSVHTKQFDFTTPNVISSWNKACKIFNDMTATTNWGDLVDTMRDQIRHPAVRAWAISILNYYSGNATYFTTAGVVKEAFKAFAKTELQKFFIARNESSMSELSLVFDSDMATARGTISYWKATSSDTDVYSAAINGGNATFTSVTEDMGDMLRSNWLFLEDHNEFTANGEVVKRYNDINGRFAHEMTHNVPTPLRNFTIRYKNMYL